MVASVLKLEETSLAGLTQAIAERHPSAIIVLTEDDRIAVWNAAAQLFDAWRFQPVRLIGMAAERLGAQEQMPLFVDPNREKQRRLDAAADRINQRFGKRAIRRGGTG